MNPDDRTESHTPDTPDTHAPDVTGDDPADAQNTEPDEAAFAIDLDPQDQGTADAAAESSG